MSITLAQLRTFGAIVRTGTFHGAAKELCLTQPSVSQRVRQLEAELNVTLFIRRGPRIALTAEGHALVGYAGRLTDDTDAMVARFRLRDPLRGVLRIGLNESFGLVCLSDLLRRLEQLYPDLKTMVHVGDTEDVSRLLNDRKLDVAVVSQPDLEPHVQALPLGTNQLGWVAAAHHPVPVDVLSPQELAQFPLTISPPTARLHATAMAWFARAGVMPTRLSTCNALSVTVLSILAGLTIGLVPLRVMQSELENGSARLVPADPGIGGHRVFLCHQVSGLGPNRMRILDVIRGTIEENRLFTV